MLTDHEEHARTRLPPHVADYFAAYAGSGDAGVEGARDWSRIRFRPRVLRDVSTVDLTTTVLGTPVRTPVLVAPMAQQTAAHADGEVAMGQVAAQAGSLLAVSTQTAVPFARIAATGVPWWFQVYVTRDRSVTARLVERAVDAGARALLLTADMNALLPSSVNPRDWPDGPGKARLGNLSAAEIDAAGPAGVATDASLGFDAIAWLQQISGLPVLVKGVLRADDARRCVDEGAAGVVVSTHGGRRLSPSVSTVRALPEVVAAIGAEAEVYADSGLRSGEHVAAALAIGARAVFVGRPLLWALASGGPGAVASVLDGFTTGLSAALVQLGVPRLSELTPDLLAPPDGLGSWTA